jgi:hypothetical protein
MAFNSDARAERAQPPAIIDDTLVRRARIECLAGELWVTGPRIGDGVLLRGESIAIRAAD